MSREVPLDQALTDKDRTYLRQLGSGGDHLERRIDASFPPDAEALAVFEAAHRTYLSKMNGTGHTLAEQDALLDENQRLKAELQALREQMATPTSSAPSYTGWSKAQLEAEIDRVNAEDEEIVAGTKPSLAKGKVVEMVATLSEYFAE